MKATHSSLLVDGVFVEMRRRWDFNAEITSEQTLCLTGALFLANIILAQETDKEEGQP